MNITYLKYICEVEKYGSISKAAQHLYINQPRLSKIIKEIEKEMNIKIFERTSKGVIATKQGRLFINQAKQVISDMNNLERICQKKHTMGLDISVARASYISKAFVNYLNELRMKDHEIKLNYHETNSMEAIKNVFENNDNLGIIRFPVDDEEYYNNILNLKDLSYEKIFEFDYLLLMSKDNVLSSKDIHYVDLSQQIELVHGDIPIATSPLRSKEKVYPSRVINIYERGSQFEILEKLTDSYMWVSPMPIETLERFNLVQKECVDMNIRCIDMLIYRKGYRFTKEDEEFLRSLGKVIKSL